MKHIRFLSVMALTSAIAIVFLAGKTWAQRTLNVPSEYSTIQQAIDEAEYGDTVKVAAGTYYENIFLTKDGISIIGAGAEVTIIDGQGDIVIDGIGIEFSQDTRISGFTIRNGDSQEGIMLDGSPRIENCTFSNNGVGIALFGSGRIENCTFSNNGGGIGIASPEGYESSVITNCSFIGNWQGIVAGNNTFITNSSFVNNASESWDGGVAILVDEGSVVITKCSFLSNFNDGYGAGAIQIAEGTSASITECIFSGNEAFYEGGAIAAAPFSYYNISKSTFIGNSSYLGGAILIAPETSGTITNCSFSGNMSGDWGGAVYAWNTIITNCTFSENQAGDGGGAINAEASSVITNCTLWGNSAAEDIPSGGGIQGDPSVTVTNCIIWGNSPIDLLGTGATYSNVGLTDFPGGEGNISADPVFVDPEAGDFHLRSSSPCIDSGNNGAPEIPESDLEGNLRIADGNGDGAAIVDMGAYEFVYAPNTPAGEDVTVSLDSGVMATFANVTIPGETSVSTSSSGPAPPAEFALGDPPIYYDINTTATYTPPVTVCITYDPMQYSDLNNLHLLHYENDAWVDVTISNDTVSHVICGEVGSFSLFVIAMGKMVYNFSGFFQPVDNLPVLNIVNAGRAIPVKFSLDGDQGLDIFLPGYPASVFTVCGTTAEDAIEETVTAGSSSLSYDASTDQYKYVWKTDRSWTGTCRILILKLNDGTYHKANFRFK